jgi:hypothetical protein
MKIRFAQYDIAHAHTAGKAAVLRANPDVEFCGVYEPDPVVLIDIVVTLLDRPDGVRRTCGTTWAPCPRSGTTR